MRIAFKSIPKIVFYCWAIPAMAGLLSLVAYYIFKYQVGFFPFFILGINVLFLGVILSIVGFFSLFKYKKKENLSLLSPKILVSSFLLASNYLLAGNIVAIVIHSELNPNHYSVEVSNECGDWHIKSIKFKSPDGKYDDFDSVPAGETVKHYYNFSGEGSVAYEAILRKADLSSYDTQQGDLIGYISSPVEGHIYTFMNFKDQCDNINHKNCKSACKPTISGRD